jgi:hypothetical protein
MRPTRVHTKDGDRILIGELEGRRRPHERPISRYRCNIKTDLIELR